MREARDALLSLQRFFAGFLDEPWEVMRAVDGQPPNRPYALVEAVLEETPASEVATPTITIPFAVNCYLPGADSRAAADDAALELRELIWQRVKWGAPPWRRVTTDRIPLYDYRGRNEVQRVRVRNAAGGDYRLKLESDQTDALAHDADDEDLLAALEALPDVEPGELQVIRRGGGLFDVVFVGRREGQEVDLMEIDASGLVPGPVVLGPMVADVERRLAGAAGPVRGESDYMRVRSFGQRTIRDEDDPKLLLVAVDLRLTFARGAPVPLGQTTLQSLSTAP